MSADVPLDNIKVKELPTIDLSGDLDLDLDNIRIQQLPPINLGITELPDIHIGITELPDVNVNANLSVDELPSIDVKTNSFLETDNRVELGLKVLALPQIDLQLGLRPMRLHLPLNFRFCLTLFGCRVFELQTSGEGMLVTEDYHPRKAEQCEQK